MRVFVTGSESFIGKEFLGLCQRHGIRTYGVDLCAPSGPNRASADICSAEIVHMIPDGTDAIVHLAAISRDADCRANPCLAYDVNVMGTVNMIEAAHKRNVRQFVFASSEWVYGEVSNCGTQTEDLPIDITSIQSEYALSKVMGEQVLRLAHLQKRIPVASVLRFGIVYGPRMHNWSAFESLVYRIAYGEPVRIGSRKTARRFVHVSDIATGILATLGRHSFEVFNLSGDRLISLGEIIDEAALVLGRPANAEETSPTSMSIRNPDCARARQHLNWTPAVDLSSGVRDLLSYFHKKEAA